MTKKWILYSLLGFLSIVRGVWAQPLQVSCVDEETYGWNRLVIEETELSFRIGLRSTISPLIRDPGNQLSSVATALGIENDGIVEAVFQIPKSQLTVTRKGKLMAATDHLSGLKMTFTDLSGRKLGSGYATATFGITHKLMTAINPAGYVRSYEIVEPHLTVYLPQGIVEGRYEVHTNNPCR